MSRRPARPPRRLRLLLPAVAGLLVLGACTGVRQIPDQYGDTTRDNFQEGCIEAMTIDVDADDTEGFVAQDLADTEPVSADEAREICTCSYEGISGPDGLTFEQFKDLNEQLEEEPAPLPEDVQAIISGCREDASS